MGGKKRAKHDYFPPLLPAPYISTNLVRPAGGGGGGADDGGASFPSLSLSLSGATFTGAGAMEGVAPWFA